MQCITKSGLSSVVLEKNYVVEAHDIIEGLDKNTENLIYKL